MTMNLQSTMYFHFIKYQYTLNHGYVHVHGFTYMLVLYVSETNTDQISVVPRH